MTLVLVRVSSDAYAAIKSRPEHLEVILDAEDFAPELGIGDADLTDRNYLGAAQFCEEHGLGDDEDDGVFRDLGVDGALAYEATYGPAFSISPESAKRASGSSKLLAEDDELREWVSAAAVRGSYIVGVVI